MGLPKGISCTGCFFRKTKGKGIRQQAEKPPSPFQTRLLASDLHRISYALAGFYRQ